MFNDTAGSFSESNPPVTTSCKTAVCNDRQRHEKKAKVRESRLKQLEDGITTLAARIQLV